MIADPRLSFFRKFSLPSHNNINNEENGEEKKNEVKEGEREEFPSIRALNRRLGKILRFIAISKDKREKEIEKEKLKERKKEEIREKEMEKERKKERETKEERRTTR